MACITIVPLVILNSLKGLWYVMVARRELGLDHLSVLDTQSLREFNSAAQAIFEYLDIGLYLMLI
jgi:hypothetical protein